VDPLTGQVVEVEQVRVGRYEDERSVFSDTDGDGFFTKLFEIETVNTQGVARQSGCEQRDNQDESQWSRRTDDCRGATGPQVVFG
ncbi:MAG: hypothetical protein ACO3P8_12425, partial [Steroidobacteraceae bacterium]